MVLHEPDTLMDDAPYHRHEPLPIVLVVDDEPAIRELVTGLLEEEGYAVRAATDGAEALAIVAREPIALVLSDVTMPRLDGPSLARRLRRHPDPIPVVLMSAVRSPVALPGVPFLPKPLDLDALLGTIDALLAVYQRGDDGQLPPAAP